MTVVRVSHDSHETFVRVSHDSRANVTQFYFLAIKSPNGLIYVAIYSHLNRIFVALCGSRKLNCDVSAAGSLLVHNGFETHAMTWRLFLRGKKYYMFKLLLPLRRLFDTMRTFCDSLETTSRIELLNSRELFTSQ